jgi:hypothetical protein
MMMESVRAYAAKKEEVENLKAILNKKREEFDTQNRELIDSLSLAKEELNEVIADVRNFALFEFTETGKKKLFGGIGIREKTVIKYDEKKALKWAKEKDMFLQLNKDAFENAIPGLSLDFVKIEKDIQVTFPKEVKIDE